MNATNKKNSATTGRKQIKPILDLKPVSKDLLLSRSDHYIFCIFFLLITSIY